MTIFLLSRFDGESAYPLGAFATVELAKAAAETAAAVDPTESYPFEWREPDDYKDAQTAGLMGIDAATGDLVFGAKPDTVWDLYVDPILEAGGYRADEFRVYELEVVG